jgi:hypothetical protein
VAVIAALFVEEGGVYAGPWGVSRDARGYPGTHPVVAHPPCKRWGRYWHGGPSARVRRTLGDDGGCFASALDSVRRWGGVLEHPEASHAWRHFGLVRPPRAGGWVPAGDGVGWTCCVEQGHYGHRARKATWLYVVGAAELPELRWGPSTGQRLDEGFRTAEERRRAKAAGHRPRPRLTARERVDTPVAFRELLLSIAARVAG